MITISLRGSQSPIWWCLGPTVTCLTTLPSTDWDLSLQPWEVSHTTQWRVRGDWDEAWLGISQDVIRGQVRWGELMQIQLVKEVGQIKAPSISEVTTLVWTYLSGVRTAWVSIYNWLSSFINIDKVGLQMDRSILIFHVRRDNIQHLSVLIGSWWCAGAQVRSVNTTRPAASDSKHWNLALHWQQPGLLLLTWQHVHLKPPTSTNRRILHKAP